MTSIRDILKGQNVVDQDSEQTLTVVLNGELLIIFVRDPLIMCVFEKMGRKCTANSLENIYIPVVQCF